MSDIEGQWGYSNDQERYYGSFGTRLEAAEEGLTFEHQGCWVGQFRKPIHPADAADFELSIGMLCDSVFDHEDYQIECAEDALDASPSQRKLLGERFRGAFRQWINEHGLVPKYGIIEDPVLFATHNSDGQVVFSRQPQTRQPLRLTSEDEEEIHHAE